MYSAARASRGLPRRIIRVREVRRHNTSVSSLSNSFSNFRRSPVLVWSCWENIQVDNAQWKMSFITTCYDNGVCGTFAKDPPTQETPFAGKPGAQTPTTDSRPTAASKSTHEQEGGKPAPTNGSKPQQTDDGKPAPASTRKTHTQISSTPLATDVNSDPTSVSDNASMTETPNAAPASVDGGSGGVSKGAAAGIAIATALLGGAIAFVIAFMLFKRRGRKTSRKYSDSSTAFITPKTEHPAYVQVSQTVPPATSAAAAHTRKESLDLSNLSNSSDFLAGVLPPGADEQTVKNRVTALLNQIQQHIDEFYRDAQVTLTPTMEKDLKRFSGASVDLVDQLKQHMPTIALKHALTSYILGIVAPEADQQSTLFPVEVAGLKENERSVGSQGNFLASYFLFLCPHTY